MTHLLHSAFDFLVAHGVWGLLLLAFLDSAGVPLPSGMDALLILVSAKTPGLAYWGALVAVFGSVAGNIFLFMAARKGRQWTRKEEETLAGEPKRFERWFRRYGLVTIFVPAVVPVLPLPLKVFVISAGAMRTRLASFLAVILAARIVRYFGEAYVGIRLGHESASWFRSHAWTFALVAALFCATVYLVLWWRDGRAARAR